jgi:oligoribonuclease (3'-5' exoribonuclease)
MGLKYCSIDIETTGLDPNEHQIIEFGAIIEDSENPQSYEDSKKYRRIVLARDGKYVFSAYAAMINAELIKTIAQIEKNGNTNFPSSDKNLTNTALYVDELIEDFKKWLYVNGFQPNERGVLEVVAAGKNFASFDRQFIQATPDFQTDGIRFHHRTLDPATAYVNWSMDKVPPSTDVVKTRAGLKIGESKHEALADAWDVIQMLRPLYDRVLDYSVAVPVQA